MSSKLAEIDVLDLNDSAFRLIAKDWFLLTAGPIDKFNTMTAAWGGFGELWNKKVCFVFVRHPPDTPINSWNQTTVSPCHFSRKLIAPP